MLLGWQVQRILQISSSYESWSDLLFPLIFHRMRLWTQWWTGGSSGRADCGAVLHLDLLGSGSSVDPLCFSRCCAEGHWSGQHTQCWLPHNLFTLLLLMGWWMLCFVSGVLWPSWNLNPEYYNDSKSLGAWLLSAGWVVIVRVQFYDGANLMMLDLQIGFAVVCEERAQQKAQNAAMKFPVFRVMGCFLVLSHTACGLLVKRSAWPQWKGRDVRVYTKNTTNYKELLWLYVKC